MVVINRADEVVVDRENGSLCGMKRPISRLLVREKVEL